MHFLYLPRRFTPPYNTDSNHGRKTVMTRKILLAVCGANKNGNTMKLADAFMQGALKAGHEVHKVFTGDNLHGCRGCGACQISRKGCVIHDVMDEVYPEFAWCDTLVLASPLFFASVSAQTKALLDRLYAIGKDDQYPKRAMALLMSAGDDHPETFAHAESFFQIISDIYGGENLGSYFAGGCDGDPGHHKISEEHLEKCRQFGAQLL